MAPRVAEAKGLISASGSISQKSEEHEAILETTSLDRIMTTNVITVDVEDLAGEAVEALLAAHIDGLPVLENDCLVGIFTVRDALRAHLDLLRGSRTSSDRS